VKTVLAVDTASATIALALSVDGRVTAASVTDGAQDHSRLLLPAIQGLLQGRLDDLIAIVAVRGPGSYAGLRVGIATARALALARGIPAFGVATLEAVAAAAGPGDFTAIHPAGRGTFAAQAFSGGNPAGALYSAAAAALASLTLVGEGAGVLGGREVTPADRCRAALESVLPRLDGPSGPLEALYLREPTISLPRRTTARPG
jgi:tRNA threonylcarbamoyl adenosine modification protein YeaZ